MTGPVTVKGIHSIQGVTIRLTHREAYASPIDECERRCLQQIRERLRWLGIPER